MIDMRTRAPANQSVLTRNWEFADVTFARILFNLQEAVEERIKKYFLRGLMPCKMGTENP
jgi:hypothetical protein